MRLNVILSSNISHYIYTARALQDAGYLKRYICAIAVSKSAAKLVRLLPKQWQVKLKARDITFLDSKRVHIIWLAEILQRGLPVLRLLSPDRGNWINNYLYDFLASWNVEACDIFHFVNGIGLYSARKAKAKGSITVCDIRTEYPDYQFQILADEYAELGIPYNPPGLSYDAKIKAEYMVSDYLIVPSRYAKRTFVEKGFDPRKIFVVPYGVDLEHFSRAADHDLVAQQDGKFRILYVGQIIPRKGVHYLIQAFNQLDIGNAELLLVGSLDDTMRSFMEVALKENPRIKHFHHLPKLELSQLYNSGSVFVLPSLADSWGLVVLEAMACGLPVIVTENVGSGEAVEEGINGYIIPIRNVEALKEKLLYLFETPDVRARMSQAALRTIDNYTWERYGQGIIKVYKEIITRERGLPSAL